jgi:hypothetical protein
MPKRAVVEVSRIFLDTVYGFSVPVFSLVERIRKDIYRSFFSLSLRRIVINISLGKRDFSSSASSAIDVSGEILRESKDVFF